MKKILFLILIFPGICFSNIIKKEIIAQYGYHNENLYCLAEAVVFEAISEPIEGKYAVAAVIKNRVSYNPKFYGATYCKATRKKNQFSYQSINKSAWLKKNIKTKADFKKLSECVRIAIIINENRGQFIKARYFMNKSMATNTKSFKKMKFIKKIGKHSFYI